MTFSSSAGEWSSASVCPSRFQPSPQALTDLFGASKRGVACISFPPAFVPAEPAVSDAAIAVSNHVCGSDLVSPPATSDLSFRARPTSHETEVVQVHASGTSAGALEPRARWQLPAARLEQPQSRSGHRSPRDPLAVAVGVAFDPPTVASGMLCHQSMLRSRQPYAVVYFRETPGGELMACACGACCGKCCSGITTETKPKPSK
jgi:hypothetical protein